jgi:hypothetical protein
MGWPSIIGIAFGSNASSGSGRFRISNLIFEIETEMGSESKEMSISVLSGAR